MKLFYSPNACSLAPHIVLRELGLPFDLIKVDLQQHLTELGEDFYRLNKKGQVPVLQLEDGSFLTEGAVISQFLVDQFERKDLLPEINTPERYQTLSWMNFIASEIHKAYSPFFHESYGEESKTIFSTILNKHYAWVDQQLDGQNYLSGSNFTIADIYLFVVTRWADFIGLDLGHFIHLTAFMQRIAHRQTVQDAIAAEAS
ncbi:MULTISPECIES: glutathione transferase GstA [Acinetobacter]|uniref:Glutathione transferase GstA n=1 Tax=Acinetobacter junii TaxID=40215 RepID=A0A365PH03_ACIJU|nr:MULTISPECIES: glutathione transferase GstA [Acinetobacter]RBA41277.1 glutathione transferase GstA [Acinetobacter junii]RBA41510.1 glutathione transferase GstA [Acinetobacter junii]RBA45354.1 glutathione transferase GstA [Acinetobacter junii]WLF73531.1 glutathione transferase GstA [Acinetobacter junii]